MYDTFTSLWITLCVWGFLTFQLKYLWLGFLWVVFFVMIFLNIGVVSSYCLLNLILFFLCLMNQRQYWRNFMCSSLTGVSSTLNTRCQCHWNVHSQYFQNNICVSCILDHNWMSQYHLCPTQGHFPSSTVWKQPSCVKLYREAQTSDE